MRISSFPLVPLVPFVATFVFTPLKRSCFHVPAESPRGAVGMAFADARLYMNLSSIGK